jgi:hypothetical protein
MIQGAEKIDPLLEDAEDRDLNLKPRFQLATRMSVQNFASDVSQHLILNKGSSRTVKLQFRFDLIYQT